MGQPGLGLQEREPAAEACAIVQHPWLSPLQCAAVPPASLPACLPAHPPAPPARPPAHVPARVPACLQQEPDSNLPGAERGAGAAAHGAQDRRHRGHNDPDARQVGAHGFVRLVLCWPADCKGAWAKFVKLMARAAVWCRRSTAFDTIAPSTPPSMRRSALGGFDFMPSPSPDYYKKMPARIGSVLSAEQVGAGAGAAGGSLSLVAAAFRQLLA